VSLGLLRSALALSAHLVTGVEVSTDVTSSGRFSSVTARRFYEIISFGDVIRIVSFAEVGLISSPNLRTGFGLT